jgi:hypothetical protein
VSTVEVEFVVTGDPGGDELRSLRRWLLDVPEFRGRVSLREFVPRPGEMGPRVDAVVLAFTEAAERSTAALDRALAAWLASRRRPRDGTPFTLRVRITPDEVDASLSTSLDNGQLDASLRAFIDVLTARVRGDRGVARTTGSARRPGDDGAGGCVGLAGAEARELARAFDGRAKAEALLRRAGLRPESFPAFEGAPHAEAFWAEVGRQLALGKAPGARRRLLAAAAAEYPGNPVFRDGGRSVAD